MNLKKNSTAPDEHTVCGRQNREALGHPKTEGVNHRTEQSRAEHPTSHTTKSMVNKRRNKLSTSCPYLPPVDTA